MVNSTNTLFNDIVRARVQKVAGEFLNEFKFQRRTIYGRARSEAPSARVQVYSAPRALVLLYICSAACRNRRIILNGTAPRTSRLLVFGTIAFLHLKIHPPLRALLITVVNYTHSRESLSLRLSQAGAQDQYNNNNTCICSD
jgi:hypothetical protein